LLQCSDKKCVSVLVVEDCVGNWSEGHLELVK